MASNSNAAIIGGRSRRMGSGGTHRSIDMASVRNGINQVPARARERFDSIPEVKSLREGTSRGIVLERFSWKDRVASIGSLAAFAISTIITMVIVL